MPDIPTQPAAIDEPPAPWVAEFEARLDLQERRWRRQRRWRKAGMVIASLVLLMLALGLVWLPLWVPKFASHPMC